MFGYRWMMVDGTGMACSIRCRPREKKQGKERRMREAFCGGLFQQYSHLVFGEPHMRSSSALPRSLAWRGEAFLGHKIPLTLGKRKRKKLWILEEIPPLMKAEIKLTSKDICLSPAFPFLSTLSTQVPCPFLLCRLPRDALSIREEIHFPPPSLFLFFFGGGLAGVRSRKILLDQISNAFSPFSTPACTAYHVSHKFELQPCLVNIGDFGAVGHPPLHQPYAPNVVFSV